MTSLFSTRRRAEELQAALEATRAPAPVADLSPGLAPLVGVATALRGLPSPEPAPDFVADLRVRLLAEAEEALGAGDRLSLPTRRTTRERRLVAAASAAIVLTGGVGIAAAAQTALPGDALYPVKRGLERAEAGLSLSASGKGRDLLEQAGGRLAEVERLLAGGGPSADRVPATLADFERQAGEGGDLLLGSYADGGGEQDVVDVREFAAEGIAILQDLARSAPPDAQDELVAAALTLRDLDQRAMSLCGSCASDLPALTLPGLLLAAAADRLLAGLDPADLDNSHPVVGGRSGGVLPGGTGGQVGVDPGTPGQPGGQVEDSLEDAVEDVVGTLLPDPAPSPSAPPVPPVPPVPSVPPAPSTPPLPDAADPDLPLP